MRFPIGRQDFRTLREEGAVYVDKTRHICRVIDEGSHFFLARPRRFGKSLTVSTMAELFSGDRELFAGLWAHTHWDFEARRRPVIKLTFTRLAPGADFAQKLLRMVARQAAELEVDLPDAALTPGEALEALVEGACAKTRHGRAVLLVDEYDKPVVDHLDDPGRVEANREALKEFYSPLKALDARLEFVFITGVSALAKVSIFSDLNHVRNLTLAGEAHTLVGITETELTTTLAEPLAASGTPLGTVRDWYNGYSFGGGAERVYNPWSLFGFLASGRLSSYWFETGTPTWLLEVLRSRGVYQLSDSVATEAALVSFDSSRLPTVPLLFQTGYLTVGSYDAEAGLYTLTFPNREVRIAFDAGLLETYTGLAESDLLPRVLRLRSAVRAGDLASVIAAFDDALASVPYQLYRDAGESFYHAICYLMLRQVGVAVAAEVSTSGGRADAVVKTADAVYVFEFKLDRSPAEALAQIRDRGYGAAYADDARALWGVGVNFDSATRRVDGYEAAAL